MKNLLSSCVSVLTVSALMASANIALAQQQVDESLKADANSLVEIEHVEGEMKVIAWDKNEVSVEGTLGERTEDFIFERNGKSIIISVKVEKKDGKSWKWGKDDRKLDKLVVKVPKNSEVDYHSPNGDLSIDGVQGGTSIDSVNGDMDASDLNGAITLNTVNGDIQAKQLTGAVTIDTVNGDIVAADVTSENFRVNTVNGDIQVTANSSTVNAESVNGDIDLTLSSTKRVSANAVNGDIAIDMKLLDGGKVRASTVGGDIEMNFEDDINARFSLETHTGGSIADKITNQEASMSKYGGGKKLNFSTGDASGLVELSTLNGHIQVQEKK